MDANTRTTDVGMRLSLLWIFVILNYLYCDVVVLMDPAMARQFPTGEVDGMPITPGFLLAGAVLMEVPMAMVVVSRLARPRTGRLLNVVAGVIMTVAQSATLLLGTPASYYLFFSVLEIAVTAGIAWYAWRWRTAPAELAAARQVG